MRQKIINLYDTAAILVILWSWYEVVKAAIKINEHVKEN